MTRVGTTRSLLSYLFLALTVTIAFRPVTASAQSEAGSILKVGEDVLVEAGETVGGVTVFGGDLEVEADGVVDGDVFVTGDAAIAGELRGDVFVGGALDLAETARIDGDVNVIGELTGEADATIGGDVTHARSGRFLGEAESDRRSRTDELASNDNESLAARLLSVVMSVILAMAFTALAVAVAPNAVSRVRDAMTDRPGPTFAVGCLAWLLMLPLFVALTLTVIGTIVTPIVYLVALLLGWVAVSDKLGAAILPGSSRIARSVAAAGLIALVFNLGAVANIVVLCGIALLWAILSCWPLGASTLTLLGTRPWPEPAPMGPVPPVEGLPDSAGSVPPWPPESDPAVPTTGMPAAPPADDDTVGGEVPGAPEGVPDVGPAAQPAMPPPAPEDLSGGHIPSDALPTEPESPSTATEVDLHLQRVPGISPVYAYLLRDAGITDLRLLAGADAERISEVASAPGVLPVTEETAAAWIEAAREMVGEGGTPPS